MSCLGSILYDPATAVTKGSAASAMAAFDTTNARLTFTVPSNGKVLVKLKTAIHGAATFSQILLGVMNGSTVVKKVAPIGALIETALATAIVAQEAMFVVDGLTPGASLTWDAAWGIETFVTSSLIKYGGPNNTTANDSFGALQFEIWDCPSNLVGKAYDPTTAVSASTASALAMTALDTTNLRATFTVPASGKVMVRMQGVLHGATTRPSILLGILEGSTVKARVSPVGGIKATALATALCAVEAVFVVSGLTPGASLTWDAAYGVETVAASTGLKYGGPDNSTANNAFGAFLFEIWAA
jgi:hypothetical protein